MICLCFIFFFFKQKTAYEVRISDWSSDVCSSDLYIASAEGGVEIEKVAAENPDAIHVVEVNYVQGLQPFQCRQLGFAMGLSARQTNQLSKNMLGLYKLFNDADLSMVELRSEEQTYDLKSLLRSSYAGFFLKKK